MGGRDKVVEGDDEDEDDDDNVEDENEGAGDEFNGEKEVNEADEEAENRLAPEYSLIAAIW